jgi:nucleoside-diphosphate-sugar epimerase
LAAQRVLVTGGRGFIGRWSLEPLRAAGYEVCAVLSPDRDASIAGLGGVEIRYADLTEPDSIDALLEAVKPTHLLHFAWIATPGVYWQSAENYRWLSASRHLLGTFRRCGGVRAVLAGSCAEYDWSRVSLCNERTSPLAPEGTATPYAACKIALQRSLEEDGRLHGLSWAWGRIFFQYGPAEDRARLVASVITSLLAGREAPCTHGRQIRSFLHVEDVGAAFAALLRSEVQGPVNIGSGDPLSIAELLERLARIIGRPELLRLGARSAPPGEPARLIPDIGRLRDEVRWNPRWTLDEGLEDTVRWWRERLA